MGGMTFVTSEKKIKVQYVMSHIYIDPLMDSMTFVIYLLSNSSKPLKRLLNSLKVLFVRCHLFTFKLFKTPKKTSKLIKSLIFKMSHIYFQTLQKP